MLAGVLLHVIKAPGPVHAAQNGAARNRAIDDMDDFAVFFANVQYTCFTNFSGIERLAAGGRIEGRAVQQDTPSRSRSGGLGMCLDGLATQNTRSKFGLERIVVIQTPGGHICKV